MRAPVLRYLTLFAMLASGYACSSSSSPATPGDGGGGSSGGDGATASSSGGDDGDIADSGVAACAPPVDAGALANVECAMAMPVQGGLSGAIQVGTGASCGSASDAQGIGELDFAGSSGDAGAAAVVVTFESEVPYDQTGTFPAHVAISQGFGDGGRARWQTPPGACSVVVSGSVCVLGTEPSPAGGNLTKRVLTGSGTCSQDAEPPAGNTASAVTIGTFAFTASVEPKP
ncbi:MAG: hypothetical protein ACRELB_17150 [Polyangiaceae bacterium]